MKKKFAAILVSALMLSTCFSGCTSGPSPSASGTTSQPGSGTSSTASQAPANSEPIKIRIEVFDRGTAGLISNDNISTKYVQDNFGTPNNIEVSFVPIPRSQEKDMLNTLMAANDAPDMCFTYYNDLVYNYVKNNGLHDLTDLLAENGPELVTFLGEEVLDYGRFNGRQYAIPAKRQDRGALTTFIRKDWLDKLGLPEPTTTEEFYNTMVAFKEKDPGGFGDGTIPFALNFSAVDIIWSSANLLDSFKTDMTDEQLATLPEFGMPGFKEGVRLLNKMYNEGLVSQNFALDKDTSQYKKDIASGKVGALTNNFDFIYSGGNGFLADELVKSVPGAEYVAVDPFQNAKGEHPKRLYGPNGISIFIPKTCKNPEAVIQYLNWMSLPEQQDYLQFGEEGVHYDNKAKGYPDGRKTNDQLPEGQILGEVQMILNGVDFGDPEINLNATAAKFPGFEDAIKKSITMAQVDGWNRPRLEVPVESEATLGATVQDKGNELFVMSITAKPADFDAVYDQLMQEYMEIGGQKILDEKIAIWQQQNK